jgi:hypothetical protein
MQTRRETQASISVSSRPEPIRAHHRPPCPLCPPGLLVLLFSTFLLAASNATARAGNLVLNYQISQWTGWTDKDGKINTIGGNVQSMNFTDGTKNGRTYTVSLAPAEPLYEGTPSNQNTIPFYQKVLSAAFGATSAFNYVGGFTGQNEFNVQSYSAFGSDGGKFGAGLYVVYNPDKGDPPINGDLHWIQVVWNNAATDQSGTSYTPGKVANFVDNDGAANPYYGGVGGKTTINGNPIFNFYDRPARTSPELASYNFKTPIEWRAEDFLVVDTNKLNANNQEMFDVYGGIYWGWNVELQSTPEPSSLVLAAPGALLALALFVRRSAGLPERSASG